MTEPTLVQALEDLIEASQSMIGTCRRYWGATPEDEDTYEHDGWAEEFLQERTDAAIEALAKAKEAK